MTNEEENSDGDTEEEEEVNIVDNNLENSNYKA